MKYVFILTVLSLLLLGCAGDEKLVDVTKNSKPFKGGENAKVTVVEYSDFQCPFCAKGTIVIKELESYYGQDIRLEYRHFPLMQIHEKAEKAAEASECAVDQGKFWEYHDKLFANQNALDTVSLKKYARELGLDGAKFDACLDSGEKKPIVISELRLGEKLGITGTPTFFVNGQMVIGAQPFNTFKTMIDKELLK